MPEVTQQARTPGFFALNLMAPCLPAGPESEELSPFPTHGLFPISSGAINILSQSLARDFPFFQLPERRLALAPQYSSFQEVSL